MEQSRFTPVRWTSAETRLLEFRLLLSIAATASPNGFVFARSAPPRFYRSVHCDCHLIRCSLINRSPTRVMRSSSFVHTLNILRTVGTRHLSQLKIGNMAWYSLNHPHVCSGEFFLLTVVHLIVASISIVFSNHTLSSDMTCQKTERCSHFSDR